jgi:hypothetical protein
MTNNQARQGGKNKQYGNQYGNNASPHRMVLSSYAHHLALRRRPVLFCGVPADLQPFKERRQLPIFGPCIPHRRPICQQQFRSSFSSFLLFAGKPVS